MILAADALPEWCHELTSSCPMLFPFDTRLLYFQCTAFGASRSIVWLQNQRDQNNERARAGRGRAAGAGGVSGGGGGAGGVSGSDDLHEFRVGRIKHERVKVPRGRAGDGKLLAWAMQVREILCESDSQPTWIPIVRTCTWAHTVLHAVLHAAQRAALSLHKRPR